MLEVQELTKPLPEILLCAADGDPAVLALEHLVRRAAAMSLPHPRWPLAGREEMRGFIKAEGNCRVEQRCLDELTFAGAMARLQRSENADRRVAAGGNI